MERELKLSGAVAGICVDIDGASWHRNGDRCMRCGFGITGEWNEPATPPERRQLPRTTTAYDLNEVGKMMKKKRGNR